MLVLKCVMIKNKSIFIKCDCHGHLLELEKYDDTDNYFSLIYWVLGGYGERMSFIERIKLCYRVMRRGKICDNEIIINDDKAKELSEFINETVKNNKILLTDGTETPLQKQ